jgi:hypothetical protein
LYNTFLGGLHHGDTGLDADKRLKIDEHLETIYLSHKPRPIKVVNTAFSETTKADEIVSETAKTGKVTVVVAVMSIFKKKGCKLRSTNLGNERPSCRQKEPIFRRKIPADQEALLKNQEKAGYQRN